jgi:hypothetical protein
VEEVATMIVLVTLILTTGGVILLRPLIKHLGVYLQVLTEQKRLPLARDDLGRVNESLSGVERRLSLLEERQQFAEALLDARHAVPSRGSNATDGKKLSSSIPAHDS